MLHSHSSLALKRKAAAPVLEGDDEIISMSRAARVGIFRTWDGLGLVGQCGLSAFRVFTDFHVLRRVPASSVNILVPLFRTRSSASAPSFESDSCTNSVRLVIHWYELLER
jgi:hypothetical protein